MTPSLRLRVAATLVTASAVLSGCWGPVHGTDAMVDESDRVLAVAEDVIPQIADELDLEIVEAESSPYTNPGMEGSPRSFVFVAEGELGGELPAQRDLEDAMTSAGLVDLVTERMGGSVGTDGDPYALGFDGDGATSVSVSWITGMAEDGLRFSVWSVERFNVSDDAVDEYFPDLIPEFDQSLVSPAADAD